MRWHNLSTVIDYEFRRTLGKPSFWIATLSLPLLLAFVMGLTIVGGVTADQRDADVRKQTVTFTYADASGLVDASVAQELGGTKAADAASARQAVEQGRAELHIDYPQDPTKQPIVATGRTIGLIDEGKYTALAQRVLTRSAEKRVSDPTTVSLLTRTPNVSVTTWQDGKPSPGWAGVFAPGFFLVAFYLTILMLGSQMLNLTVEEKENRVTEMILTTIKPTTLIVGKLLALALVGIVQLATLGAAAGLIGLVIPGATQSLGSSMGSDPALSDLPPFPGIIFEPWPLVVGLLLFLGGFVMISGFLVAIGALMPNAKEASGAFGFVIVALFLPFYVMGAVVSDPHGLISTVLTWFPLTTPVTALLRNAMGSLSVVEAIGAIVWVFAFGALMVAWGVRLFRTGSIAYDVKMSLATALRGFPGVRR